MVPSLRKCLRLKSKSGQLFAITFDGNDLFYSNKRIQILRFNSQICFRGVSVNETSNLMILSGGILAPSEFSYVPRENLPQEIQSETRKNIEEA